MLTERRPLFICDMANNHYGDVSHAKQIIDELTRVKHRTQSNIAIKFQFRDLDTYLHPEFQMRTDLKFIKRFVSTRLEKDQYADLVEYARGRELLVISTPFDEPSVDFCVDLNLDYIKIASASSNDYPLIEKISKAKKSVIASTAGLRIDEIDNLVFRLKSQVPSLTVMHCVAIYPCTDDELRMNQIQLIRKRYHGIEVGFSTHERRDSLSPVVIATVLGATVFERHVGIVSKDYPLNDYSSEPLDIENWINAQKTAQSTLGPIERAPSKAVEVSTLLDLKRGIYAKKEILRGEKLDDSNTFFAFPVQTEVDQLHAGGIESNLISTSNIPALAPITLKNSEKSTNVDSSLVREIKLQVLGILSQAGVFLNGEAEIELSHHYGLERFREYGAILITCYNNEYAKKLVVQLPRQKHPYHYHQEKKETFQLLWGDMEITVDGHVQSLSPGELLTVERGQWHKFQTSHGAVVEEISTEAKSGDSFYEDPFISSQSNSNRKTRIGSLEPL